jgi:hypothetical protein
MAVDFTKALKGKTFERKPYVYLLCQDMETHPNGSLLPMAVHQGKWKFIRTFHYGENGKAPVLVARFGKGYW